MSDTITLLEWLRTRPGGATRALSRYGDDFRDFSEGQRAAFVSGYRMALHLALAAPEFAGQFAMALRAEEAIDPMLRTSVEELTADARGEATLLAAVWAKELEATG